MNILLFIHWSLMTELVPNAQAKDLSAQLKTLEALLTSKGHHVTFFHPFQHKIRDYDLVHFFERGEGTFWKTLAVPVAVTLFQDNLKAAPSFIQEIPPLDLIDPQRVLKGYEKLLG